MKSPPRPLKPFKNAIWNDELFRWEGKPKKKPISFEDVRRLAARKNLIKDKFAIKFHLRNDLPPPYDYKKLQEFKNQVFLKMPKKKKRKILRDQQNQAYKALKPKWRALPENQFCKRCMDLGILTQAENYPHHKKGRVGELLCDTRYFMPICKPCHVFIHDHPSLSYQAGYLIKSSSKQT